MVKHPELASVPNCCTSGAVQEPVTSRLDGGRGRAVVGSCLRPLLMLRQPDADAHAVRGMTDAGRWPVTRDHVEHLTVAVQYVHLE